MKLNNCLTSFDTTNLSVLSRVNDCHVSRFCKKSQDSRIRAPLSVDVYSYNNKTQLGSLPSVLCSQSLLGSRGRVSVPGLSRGR